MSNKVFYQHPNLMRALGMHETVMEVMVNVLGGGDSKVYFLFHLAACKFAQSTETKVANNTNIVCHLTFYL